MNSRLLQRRSRLVRDYDWGCKLMTGDNHKISILIFKPAKIIK